MFARLARAIFGSANDRSLKRFEAHIPAISAFEATLEGLSDETLRDKTAEFRARLEQGTDLDDLLEEAFAVAVGAGEGPLLGPEEFALHEVLGNRATVHRNERRRRRVVVEAPHSRRVGQQGRGQVPELIRRWNRRMG